MTAEWIAQICYGGLKTIICKQTNKQTNKQTFKQKKDNGKDYPELFTYTLY